MSEYLKVLVPDWDGTDIWVMINRRKLKRRKVGRTLTLRAGPKRVSVNRRGAVEQSIDLQGTTPSDPHVVTIEIES